MVAGDQFRGENARLGGLALFDISLTLVGAIGLSIWRPWATERGPVFLEVILIFFVLWIIGIALHTLTKQKTMSGYYLSLSDKPDVLSKDPN